MATISNVHENLFIKGYVFEGILYAEFKERVIDLPVIQACVELRTEAIEGQSFPIVLDATIVKTVTKEARDFLSSPIGTNGVTATALLIDSNVGKFLGNFFLHLNRPSVPLKIFTDASLAKNWICRFLDR
ncbi:MAG: hypothetical protein SGJ04_10535 [Bacteroidota bacterium]|nr:hypothetical protein [Bacteroidota bacterium]